MKVLSQATTGRPVNIAQDTKYLNELVVIFYLLQLIQQRGKQFSLDCSLHRDAEKSARRGRRLVRKAPRAITLKKRILMSHHLQSSILHTLGQSGRSGNAVEIN